MRTALVSLLCCLVLCALSPAADPPAPPKPGPEHALLKQFEGEWEGTMKSPAGESKAMATYKLGYGGFWLTLDVKGEFGGQKFEGRGTTGYDPIKKKYVGTFIDSVGPSLAISEGTFDKEGKTLTETGEAPGPDGKTMKFKSVSEFKDKDTLIFTMYDVKEGKDQEFFKITYKRKK
jgi:hypothetical protein